MPIHLSACPLVRLPCLLEADEHAAPLDAAGDHEIRPREKPGERSLQRSKGERETLPRMSIEGESPREGESEDRRAQQVLNIQWAMLGIHLCLGHCIVAVC